MTQARDQQDALGASSGLSDRAISIESDGFVASKQIGVDQEGTVAVPVRVKVPDLLGVLNALTQGTSHHRATFTNLDSATRRADRPAAYADLGHVDDPDGLLRDLEGLPIRRDVEQTPSFGRCPRPIVRISGVSGLPSIRSRAD
jgi:hypothetical protein